MGGKVIPVSNSKDWEAKHAQAKKDSKIVVVDFFAVWCGPCRVVSPYFEQLSEEFPNAVFLKVDVDEASDVAKTCSIRAMPTFQLWKDMKKVDEVVGANKDGLLSMIKKHYSKSGGFQGSGHKLGDSSGSAPAAAATTGAAPSPSKPSNVDPSKPVTSIKIRLPDGGRLIAQFNLSQTVGDLRQFVRDSVPGQAGGAVRLSTQFPNKLLTEDAESVEGAGLANSTVLVAF